MKITSLRILAAILAFAVPAGADSVTSRDSRSWNGKVTLLKNGVLTLAATFPGGPATLQFGPNTLRAIEFNPTTFNPGAAPKLTQVNAGALSGTIYLRDKSGHPCGNMTIDANTVTCSAGSWPRSNVLRIIFSR